VDRESSCRKKRTICEWEGVSFMVEITDDAPASVEDELRELRTELDDRIPAKWLDHNLLIGTWNIRCFGNVTKKWVSTSSDSPKRDLHSLLCIAEIVSRFDVVAIQEVTGNLRALRYMLKYLNYPDPHWGLILTDVTRGDPGHDERLAFVFDKRRANLSGLACELVIPEDKVPDAEAATLRQFARTPYAVSFVSGNRTFILVTLHVIYGNVSQREAELKKIAEWLSEWARQVNAWDHNLIALGDFNTNRRGDKLYDAFTSTGLEAPQELHDVRRTIFADSAGESYYDQVAWFTGDQGAPRLSLEYTGRAGGFDFVDLVLKDRALSKTSLSWRISDHYPLYVEFSMEKD